MTNFATLNDLDVKGRRVLVRSDLNVPVQDGVISDATRIDRGSITIAELSAAGAKVIVLSHFRRPLGQRIPEMSLRPVAKGLSDALGGKAVAFSDDCIGEVAIKAVAAMKNGDILLLENVRFHKGEEANDPEFAKSLAALGDLYVNDAFSCAHRAHASTEALAGLLPSAAGRNMEAELSALDSALGTPERPVAAVVGGAKISSKLELLTSLVDKVDTLVIGGAMANTFLQARGFSVGTSLCEPDLVAVARTIDLRASATACDLVLPFEVVIAESLTEGAPTRTISAGEVPEDMMILDVGPAAVSETVRRLTLCKTVVWNGPMGAFEIPPFDAGTNAVAQAVGTLCRQGDLLAVAGGGDTVSALTNAGVADEFTYLSTAGGAFLEWLEGKELPGVAALSKAAAKAPAQENLAQV
ncbi:MAG: phosphoglycerate kinase [Alphaproteobacteria bacterium]|nr:phosphoglycerate kinase [Alphaproteobacteria bacterium]MBT5861261.1 phosphoglycerate kinase [Alphaproteobacteria bacterium]